ncbi:8983_t:CDS:2, partial [Gigaspora rosea]
STKEFECISSSENNSRSQATIFGQITLFGSVGGLFFNIAVYGVTSKLDIKTTLCSFHHIFLFRLFPFTILHKHFPYHFSYPFATSEYKPNSSENELETGKDKLRCFSKKVSQTKFDIIRSIFIWILFINSVLILLYDILEIRYGTNYKSTDSVHINAIIDLEFLSFLTDIINFVLASSLIWVYFKKPLPKDKQDEQKKHVVMKKAFFIVIFLTIIKCFFEYNRFCTPKTIDAIFFFVLSTVLTRSIVSFFSHDKHIRILYIANPGFFHIDTNNKEKNKFVLLKLTDKDQIIAFLGKQRLYIKIKDDEVEDDKDKNNKVEGDEVKNIKKNETFIVDIKNIYLNFKTKRFDYKLFWETVLKLCKKEIVPELDKWHKLEGKNGKLEGKNDKLEGKNDKLRKSNYDFIRAILYDLKKKELNEKTEKLMAEKLLECGKIYVDILEAGLFQYLIYSHRSYKEHKHELLTEETFNKFQDLLNNSDLNHILNENGNSSEENTGKNLNSSEENTGKNVNSSEENTGKNVNSSEENTGKDVLKMDDMKKIGERTKQLRKIIGKSESPKWEVIYSIQEFKYLEKINDKKLANKVNKAEF